MITLLAVPYVILIVCSFTNLDFSIGLYIYGSILAFNMVYAFLMPKFGANGKQLLFWNLLLKLCHIPLVLLILVFTLIMTVIGGEGIHDEVPAMIMIALLSCYMLQISSAMFGISGFLWCRKYGRLPAVAVVFSTIAQLTPCVDIVGSILCYILFRKKGQTDTSPKTIS